MRSRDLIRRIKDFDPGATMSKQVGSHQKWVLSTGCRITVPVHRGDIPRGTLASIERQGEPCLGAKWLTGPTGR